MKAWLNDNAITPNEAQNVASVSKENKYLSAFELGLNVFAFLLSCMIKIYNLRGSLCVPCAFPIFTRYQKALCLTQPSITCNHTLHLKHCGKCRREYDYT